MASVTGSMRRIKDDLERYVPAGRIGKAAVAAGHKWRERQLGPAATVHLLLLQVLWFNTAMTHLRHLAGMAVKAPAYCRARKRLPLAVLATLLRESADEFRRVSDDVRQRAGAAGLAGTDAAAGAVGLWCGLVAVLVDGSSTITPDTKSCRKVFGLPGGCKPGCGFPVPKVLAMFDAFTGMLIQMLAFPLYTHEQSKVWMLHPLLGKGHLLVGDRGFCSYVHFAMLGARGVQGLFRCHQKQIVDFRKHRKHGGKGKPKSRFVRRLGKHDQVVEWKRPKVKPKWMTAAAYAQLPETLLVRELRYVMPRDGRRTVSVTIATTLLDPVLYPKQKIADLYGVRWSVETHFAELKTTLGMRKLKSKTADGILKELIAYALVYNLVRGVMLRAAQRQGVPPDRISFIDTVRWLLTAAAGEELPDLVTNPLRPGRHEPRVVKDRHNSYPVMNKPRQVLRKALKNKAKAA
jgi:hypothetical protein